MRTAHIEISYCLEIEVNETESKSSEIIIDKVKEKIRKRFKLLHKKNEMGTDVSDVFKILICKVE